MTPAVWMFSGQGSQYFGMGRDLYESEPAFRRAMDECAELLAPALGLRLTDEIYRERADRFAPFDRTLHSSPAIVAMQYATARALRARGYAPDAVLGYSLGEVSAGIVAGALSLEGGLLLAVRMAELMEADASEGAMLAVLDDADMVEREPARFEGAWIGARNFDGHFVLSGRPEAIGRIEAELAPAGVGVQRLPVRHAFHSPMIESAGPGVRDAVASTATAPAAIDMISASDGRAFRVITSDDMWATVREPVRFDGTVAAIEARGGCRYVDVGPSGTLATFVKYALPPDSVSEIASTVTPFGAAAKNLDRFFPRR